MYFFQKGNTLLSKTVYLQYGLPKINKSIKQAVSYKCENIYQNIHAYHHTL